MGDSPLGEASNPLNPLNSEEWHRVLVGNGNLKEAVARVVSGYTKAWHEPVLRHTYIGQTVLETGSGTGQVSLALAKEGRKAFLLDLSFKNLEFSKNVFKCAKLDGEFIQADILKSFPFCNNAFDCVWSAGVLEHFTDEEIEFIIKESGRVAKSLVISLVPNAASIPYRVGKFYQEMRGYWMYGKESPKYTMRAYFEKAGLKNIIEYSIDPRHSFEFLTMLKNRAVGKLIMKLLHVIPLKILKALNQGWLLVTIGVKDVKNNLGIKDDG